MQHRVRRMVVEARARLADADILGQSLRAEANSQALLRILALEILLKAVQLKTSGAITRSHHYVDIWSRLPKEVRKRVIEEGTLRYAGHIDLNHVEKLLHNFEWLFVKARYGYELYEGVSDEEMQQAGEEWIARGAPTEEADIQFRPTELAGLIFGLLAVVESAA